MPISDKPEKYISNISISNTPFDENVDDSIYFLTLEGIYEEVNFINENHDIMLQPENLYGKNIGYLLDKNTKKEYKKLFNSVIENGIPQHINYSLTVDGKTNWYSDSFILRKNIKGIPFGVTIISRNITKTHILENTLAKSKMSLNEILHSIPGIIFIIDLDGIFEDVYNNSGNNDLFIPKEEIIGKHYKDIGMSVPFENFEKYWEKTINTGQPQEYNYSVQFESELKWFNSKVNLRKNHLSEPIGFTSIVRNITKEREIELSLVASKASLASIFNSIADLIILVSLEGVYEKVYDHSKSNILLFSSDEIIGKHFKEILPKETCEQYEQQVSELIRTGIPQKYEYSLFIDGEDKWFSAIINLRKNTESKPVGITSIIRNISELKLSELKFKTIVEFSQSWEYWTGNKKELIYVSPACEKISGYTQDEFYNDVNLYINIIHPEDKLIYQDHLDGINLNKENANIEFRIISKSGEIRWIQHHCLEVYNENMHSIGRRGSNEDITTRKDYNNRIAHLASHDSLTNLPNRLLLINLLEKSISRAERNKWKSAVLFIDFDNFKSINDNYGHQIGDQYLQYFAKNLGSIIRNSDTLARLSGDEFVVILENIGSEENIESVGKNIIAKIAEKNILNPKNILVGASIGVSIIPDHGDAPDVLIRKADQAMYQSKSNGKNLLTYYSDLLNIE